MATVKLQNGKVILKDGKVSCSCCEEPGDCCMYPAAALVDDLYSYEDLPDAIDVGGIEYTKLDPPESVAGFTRYYINSNSEYLGILEGEGEDSTWTYEGGGGPCLINGFNGEGGEREDQFADTYTFASAGMTPPSVVVTRRSLCRWDFFEEDPEGGGRYWILEYANDRGPDALWYFTIPSTFPGYKTGLQNSPVGTYTGIEGTWTGTIS